MTTLDELIKLEHGFWEATRDPDYYARHMRDDGLAVFGEGIMDKEAARRSTMTDAVGEDWTNIRIADPRVLAIADDVAALVYHGSATRAGTPYRANCASVYARREGEWQMVLHQQSPVPEDVVA